MIQLEEFGIPRPGWPGRRRAIAVLALQTIAGAALLIGLLVIAFVLLWLGAPEGAAWPR